MNNKPNFIIKQITPKEVLKVRQPVLRQGKPIEACVFDGDDLQATLHLGLYINNNLTSVASFMQNLQPLIQEKNQYQLRGMAVLEEFQGKGFGFHILKHGEDILHKKGFKTVWCNAREVAVSFYKKSGYSIIGNSFIIPDIGLHYITFKNI